MRHAHLSATIALLTVIVLASFSVVTADKQGQEKHPPLITGSLTSEKVGGEDPWILRTRSVQMDLRNLSELAATAVSRPRASLALFEDRVITIEVRRAMVRGDDDFSISGVVPGIIGSDISISRNRNAVSGVVSVPGIGFFNVRPIDEDGIYEVAEIDPSLLPPSGTRPELFVGEGGLPPIPTGGGGSGGPVTLRVLVVYTPAAKSNQGGQSGMLSWIDTAMTQLNTALLNSETVAQVELALAREVSYVESGDMSTDLNRLVDPADGHMDLVHFWRDLVAADLVALITTSGQYCGLAKVMGNPTPAFASLAFSVTRVQCQNFTFAHELGHNMGCAHDHAQSGGGSYPYSHGHHFVGDSGQLWRTVMAYPPGTRVPHFSNPDVIVDGQPTGVPPGQPGEAHNALTINRNAYLISTFGGVCEGGTTIRVPEDYATIQAAIDVAAHCDEIIVAPGTYYEQINFTNIAPVIYVRSELGAHATIIHADGTGTAVTWNDSLHTVLDGFTITGGLGGMGVGGGIDLTSSNPTIANCIILGNTSTSDGAGMVSRDSSPTVINCTFVDNVASGDGGGMMKLGGGVLRVIDCTFSQNAAGGSGGGISIQGSRPGIATTLFCANAPNHIDGNDWLDGGGNVFLTECPAPPCAADLNGDGVVNAFDLLLLLGCWGPVSPGSPCEAADLNEDGDVGVADLLQLLSQWGDCVEASSDPRLALAEKCVDRYHDDEPRLLDCLERVAHGRD